MCNPILVIILIKMQPHNSKSSRENATPSRGTYPLAYYWEVPNPLHPPSPPYPSRGRGRWCGYQNSNFDQIRKEYAKQYPDLELPPINYLLSTGMLAYRTVCHFLNSIKHEQEQYAFNTILRNQLCVNENPPKFMIPMIAFTSKV